MVSKSYICSLDVKQPRLLFERRSIVPASTAKQIVVVTPEQYRVIFAPQVKLKTPMKYFDIQAKLWVSLGLLTLDEANKLRRHVPDKHNFLVVPDLSEADLKVLMKHMLLDGKQGKSRLGQEYLTDLEDTPKGAHLLLDINDGWSRRNTKPSVAQQQIKAERRLAFTAHQGVAFGIVFPNVLREHTLELVGSRFASDNVPRLGQNQYGTPILDDGYYMFDDPNPLCGAPSAGSVVEA